MKYIDAEKLITIIEERKAQQDQWVNSYHDPINQGISQELTEILSLITSLQQEQPEVDLEKEIDTYFHDWIDEKPEDENPNGIEIRSGKYAHLCDIEKAARRFYELGLNARKDE